MLHFILLCNFNSFQSWNVLEQHQLSSHNKTCYAILFCFFFFAILFSFLPLLRFVTLLISDHPGLDWYACLCSNVTFLTFCLLQREVLSTKLNTGNPAGRHRWVEYAEKGRYNASQVPPEWHGWLHHITDSTGDEASFLLCVGCVSQLWSSDITIGYGNALSYATDLGIWILGKKCLALKTKQVDTNLASKVKQPNVQTSQGKLI